MNVVVLYKRGQQRLRAAKASILGDGLLERARSTSLALLGATAAVGLAMVAMALNQDWPLIAGAPIPGLGDKQQAVGDAAVVETAKAPSGPALLAGGAVARQGPEASARHRGEGRGGTPAPVDSQPQSSESIVVSNSAPVSSNAGGSPGGSSPTRPGSQQAVTTPTQAPPAPTPAAPPPDPVASVSAPPSQAPVSSGGAPPPESPEVDEDHDEDCPPEEEELDDDDGHSHGWYHGHGHGHW